ncbi:porin family protein [Denitrobaculum tricleocarpae]|uniref:Porin family protein n=2 Tax=Denitrobaculum tricleocarpae TaxID=2591009 RepID=A0A545TU41_9PROT|nr:porin family protein [Denitrobaculum tricleocarpae]
MGSKMNFLKRESSLSSAATAAKSGAKSHSSSILLSLAALCLSPATASAQEVKDNWTGPYVGLTLGLQGTAASIDSDANGEDLDLDDSGVAIGLLGGYNFSPFGRSDSGQWLIGAEVDAQFLGSDDSANDSVLGTATLDSSWVASTRVRAGYAWEYLHLYGTAGLALSDIHVETMGDDDDGVRAGLALGLGAEYAIDKNWSGRLEGISYSFGEDDRRIAGSEHDIGIGAAVIRIGVSRRF